MWFPIIVIVSLFTGALNVSKKIESPEVRLEKEAFQYRLSQGDPVAVQYQMEQDKLAFQQMYENGKAISSFGRIPRQDKNSLGRLGVYVQ